MLLEVKNGSQHHVTLFILLNDILCHFWKGEREREREREGGREKERKGGREEEEEADGGVHVKPETISQLKQMFQNKSCNIAHKEIFPCNKPVDIIPGKMC